VPEEDPGLRQSFGSIADGYDRFRPGPPEEAVQWALDPFAEPERQVIRWTRLMAKEDLVGMAGTYSAIITMPVVERDEYLSSMSHYLETHEVPISQGSVEVPTRCVCWRTTRR
jgi:hypothetical protein